MKIGLYFIMFATLLFGLTACGGAESSSGGGGKVDRSDWYEREFICKYLHCEDDSLEPPSEPS